MRIKKIVSIVLAFTTMMSGLYILKPETKEVQAAETTQSSSNTVEPNEVAEGMLDVKMQTKMNDDGSVSLRLVSSVNGLGYRNVGFEVGLDADGNGVLDGTPNEFIKFTTGNVAKRIDASVTGVTYNYSPKVIDTDAEYFVTCTLEKINAKYLDADMYVRAYCRTMDGQVVYGTGRYFKINDATAAKIVNIPVKMDAAPTTDENDKIKDVEVKINGTATTATLEKYIDGYAHVNVAVPDSLTNKTALPSASKVEIGTASAIYRNLESDYTGEGTEDTSWYDEYIAANSDETKFVIATAADLYGFSKLGQTETFSGDTIYMVADIDANDGDATPTGFTSEDATIYDWTPIGTSAASFAGTFDGQMHTIEGVQFDETVSAAGSWGLFGVTGNCTVQNLTLANSYMKITAGIAVYLGSVAGTSNGMFKTIKVADDVYVNHTKTNATVDHTGGIVGYMTGDATSAREITNCWFDGTVTAKTTIGGILGTTYNTPLGYPTTINNCLNTGTIELNNTGTYIGGLCGDIDSSELILTNSVNAAVLNKNDKTISYYGSAIGRIRCNANQSSAAVATINNTYAVGNENGWARFASNTSKGYYSLNGNTVLTGSGNIAESYCSTLASIKSGNSYCNMNLDFTIKDVYEGVWTVTKATPVLSSFVSDEEILDLDEVTTPRTLWYTKAAEGTQEYILYSTADMRGFASLVNGGTSFSGKTVKLGADITMNKGEATAEAFVPAEGTDLFEWTPMKIEGTFDGDGYTISGVYVDAVNGDGSVGLFTTVTGTVRNFRLLNSYFNHADATTAANYDKQVFTAPIGSVAGTLSGTVDTVYSDAIVKHAGAYAGGLVGVVSSTGTTNTITNCCYAGSVSANSGVGGILGLVVNTSATITHCLNIGTVSGAHSSGGLCGYVWNYNTGNTSHVLTLTDSLNLGKYTDTATVSNNFYGGAIGYLRNGMGQVYVGADTDATYVMGWDREGNNTWKRFAWESNNGRVEVDGVTIAPNSVEENFWTIQAIMNKQNNAGAMNLSFYPEGQDSSNDGETKTCWWLDEEGKIPMLESFEDLLTDVTF